MQTVHIEREVPTNPMVAYGYFTVPDLLTTWWPTEVGAEVVVGGEYRMFFEDHGVTLRGQYRRIDPGRQLAFTWKWDHEDLPPRLVDVIFTPAQRGCVVSVTHDAGSDEEASDYTNGWIHFLGRLKRAIEQASA